MKKTKLVKAMRIFSTVCIFMAIVLLQVGTIYADVPDGCKENEDWCDANEECCSGLCVGKKCRDPHTECQDVGGPCGGSNWCCEGLICYQPPGQENEKCVAEIPVCGNEIIEVGEDCDDGNDVNGDGCSALCTIETCEDVCGEWSAWSTCNTDGMQYSTRTCTGTGQLSECPMEREQPCIPECDTCCDPWTGWSPCHSVPVDFQIPTSFEEFQALLPQVGLVTFGWGLQFRVRQCSDSQACIGAGCLPFDMQNCCIPLTAEQCPTECGYRTDFPMDNLCGGTIMCPATGPCEGDIDCEGEWSACEGPCGSTGTQTFTITQQAEGNGLECEFKDGETRECETDPCNLCGNGVLDPGESCDDGNRINGDGCNASCATELPPPEIAVTGAGGPVIPVTGVDLRCELANRYFLLSKVSMLLGMGCFGLSFVLDKIELKKEE